MPAPYKPPEMPSYPTSSDDVVSLLVPYYREKRPMDLFFEFLILDVLGELPAKAGHAIDKFAADHAPMFAKTNGDWRAGVRNVLNLSSTIDVAILDLWYRNRAKASQDGWSYHPWHYSRNFLDNYFADGSQVDQWHGDALEQAKRRIQEHRSAN
jgi:hypothetical protein